ncbi:MAG TPA: hypothetical protein VEH28_07775 [Thermoplasmata archaeon]|nr:hypothetical protein [Thermoplasmata archaeon]
MTTTWASDESTVRARRLGPVATAAALGAALGLMVLIAPGAAAWSTGIGGPVSWTNGVVLCQFAAVSPSVAVSALSLTGSGVTVSLLSVVEAGPTGSVAATTSLDGLSWTVANWSNEDAFDLAYSLHAPLSSTTNPPSTVGSTDLQVQFVLPAYEGSPKGPTDEVNVVFSLLNWTWQHPGDHLVLSFTAAPTFPLAEHLNATAAPHWLLSSTSNQSGAVLEQIGANASATAATGTGPASSVSASPALTIASPSKAVVNVTFGSSAGTFSSLTYTAQVGVVLPATVAGIPLSELAAAGVAGVAVSLAVAGIVRRVRRRPSKLVYVTEEETQ